MAGATIEVLWPEKPKSKPEQRRDVSLAHHNDYGQSLSHLAQEPIKVHDGSHNNKNSIMFTFAFENHRLLFTGDAWAEDVVRAAGYFDLIKLLKCIFNWRIIALQCCAGLYTCESATDIHVSPPS